MGFYKQKTIQKTQQLRKNLHYADIFSKSFNAGLISPHEQLSILETPKTFNNEVYLKDKLQQILSDLRVPSELIKNYALILFNDVKQYLLSVRCITIDGNLNICEEQNLSEYIKVDVGIITENVVEENSVFNNPTQSITLKQKAKDKINQKELTQQKETNETENIG